MNKYNQFFYKKYKEYHIDKKIKNESNIIDFESVVGTIDRILKRINEEDYKNEYEEIDNDEIEAIFVREQLNDFKFTFIEMYGDNSGKNISDFEEGNKAFKEMSNYYRELGLLVNEDELAIEYYRYNNFTDDEIAVILMPITDNDLSYAIKLYQEEKSIIMKQYNNYISKKKNK